MPLKFPDYQKAYTERFNANGLPVANVLQLGAGRWVTVCPLCGCGHDCTSIQGDVYTPKCLLKRTHPTVYAKWVKAHPLAAEHSSILLQRLEPTETIISKPVLPARRAA